MGLSEIAITVAAVGSGILASAAGFGFVNPRAARSCLWLAALGFGSIGVIWAYANPDFPMTTRLIVSGIIGAMASMGLTWLLAQVPAEAAGSPDKSKPPVTPVTHNQSGGQSVAGNATNNGPVYNGTVFKFDLPDGQPGVIFASPPGHNKSAQDQ